MDSQKVAGLMLLTLLGYSYYISQPNDPVLSLTTPTAEDRHDLDVGSPFEKGGDYQPAAQSGSGQTPAYTSYQFQ